VIGAAARAPGDWVVGDVERIVVVPGERVDELRLNRGEGRHQEPDRHSVLQGVLTLVAVERYGTVGAARHSSAA
jgi:regulator of RNase E activity RraA